MHGDFWPFLFFFFFFDRQLQKSMVSELCQHSSFTRTEGRLMKCKEQMPEGWKIESTSGLGVLWIL